MSEIAESIEAGSDALVNIADLVTTTVALEPGTDPGITATPTTTVPTRTVPTTTTVLLIPGDPVPYLAVGDAVMLGAAPALLDRGLLVDATVSRQMIDMIPVFEQFRDRGLFGNAVVVHLSTNGPFAQATLDAFLATMDQVPNVVLMTVRAERPWTAEQCLDPRRRPQG